MTGCASGYFKSVNLFWLLRMYMKYICFEYSKNEWYLRNSPVQLSLLSGRPFTVTLGAPSWHLPHQGARPCCHLRFDAPGTQLPCASCLQRASLWRDTFVSSLPRTASIVSTSHSAPINLIVEEERIVPFLQQSILHSVDREFPFVLRADQPLPPWYWD